MFQVRHNSTNKVLDDQCHTEREAQRAAICDLRSRLEETAFGRRALSSLKNVIPWSLAQKEYTVLEMIGVWIDTDQGKLMPEETTEENDIVFIDVKGNRHLGLFDAEDGLYLSETGSTFTPERVVEYMILPEPRYTVE